MRIKAYKGYPTTFYFTALELSTQDVLIQDLLNILDFVFSSADYSAYTFKGYTQKILYPKGHILKGGFILPENFLGNVYDLCQIFNLYYTQNGFFTQIIPTGRFLNINPQSFTEPIFLGDTINSQIVKHIDYSFDNINSIGGGYAGF